MTSNFFTTVRLRNKEKIKRLSYIISDVNISLLQRERVRKTCEPPCQVCLVYPIHVLRKKVENLLLPKVVYPNVSREERLKVYHKFLWHRKKDFEETKQGTLNES